MIFDPQVKNPRIIKVQFFLIESFRFGDIIANTLRIIKDHYLRYELKLNKTTFFISLALMIVLIEHKLSVHTVKQLKTTKSVSTVKQIDNTKPQESPQSILSKTTEKKLSNTAALALDDDPIQFLLKKEAAHLYDFDQNSNFFQDRIRSQVNQFSVDQLDQLRVIAIDESFNQDERLVAVYYLKSAGSQAHRQLQDIFFSDSPLLHVKAKAHSTILMHQEFEVNLRSMAIESVEENIFNSGGQLKLDQLKDYKLANNYLNGLYRLVALGEKSRRPLLKEFIDHQLVEGFKL